MTTLYLIRHAEAEGNLYRRIHGQYDSLVTENGYRQIQALEKRFADVRIDAVYSSDLFRTMTTARAIYLPKHLPLHLRKDLREISMGEWEDRSWASIDRAEHPMMQLFSATSPVFRAPGGESFEEVRRRASRAILEIAGQHPNETVAIFSHGTAIRNVLAHFKGYSLEESQHMGHSDNTAVSCLQVENGQVHILYMDDNTHLSKEISTLANQHWWKKEDTRPDINLWFAPIDLKREQDRQDYLTAREEAWRNLYGRLDRYDGGGFLADAKRSWKQNRKTLLFAMAGKDRAGILQLNPNQQAEERKGYISFFYLSPNYRFQGIGVQMIGKAVSTFRPMGRERLALSCSAHNAPALHFYQKYGFQKTGAGAGAYGTLYHMEKYIGYQYQGELG